MCSSDLLGQIDFDDGKIGFRVSADHFGFGAAVIGERHFDFIRSLDDSINGVYHRTPVVLTRPDASYERAQELMLSRKIGLIPVLDEDRKVVELLTWNQVFSKPQKRRWETIDLPVVIMAGGKGTLAAADAVRTVGSYWPYATTLFDYVRRAMPVNAPMSLTNDEVYAATAYVLNVNGIIGADAVMNAQTLPQVVMPNRGGFIDVSRK